MIEPIINPTPTVNGMAIKKNSSIVTPAQISNPNPTITNMKLHTLFGSWPDFELSIAHHAIKVIEKTRVARTNMPENTTGVSKIRSGR